MMRILLCLSMAVAGARAVAAPVATGDAKEVKAVISSSINSVLSALKDKNLADAERRGKVFAVVDPLFDLPLMGKLVLGRAHWGKLSESQRKEYTALFISTIKDSYYEKITLFTDETVDLGEPAAGEKGKYEMLTFVNSKGKRYNLLYKIYRSGAAWRVYDMEIEGISLVRAYGSQYDQFLQKSSIEGLLVKMKEKSLETPKELKSKRKAEAASGEKS